MTIPPAPAQSRIDDGGLMARSWLNFLQRLAEVVRGYETAVLSGTGSPETVVTAPVGTLYRNLSGGAGVTIWVKESGTGNTGWVAK